MSKRQIQELQTQIKNLKKKQAHILKSSKNNHDGMLYWKNKYENLALDACYLRKVVD